MQSESMKQIGQYYSEEPQIVHQLKSFHFKHNPNSGETQIILEDFFHFE